MTLNEWRKSGERLAMASELLRNETLREMLSIMDTTEHPARGNDPLQDGFGAAVAMGEIRGYERFQRTLMLFAEPMAPPKGQVPITWNVKPSDQPLV